MTIMRGLLFLAIVGMLVTGIVAIAPLHAQSNVVPSVQSDDKSPGSPKNSTAISGISPTNLPFTLHKDPGWSMSIQAKVTNPVTAAASITFPNGTIKPFHVTFFKNGTATLSFYSGQHDPSGNNVILFNIVSSHNTRYEGASVSYVNYNPPGSFTGSRPHS